MSSNDFSVGAEKSRAVIYSLEGIKLSADEKALFRDADPLGFILFSRNCETPEQLRSLTDSLKNLAGRNCPVLIDQEGGRVQRLKPPIWRGYPAMQSFGARAEVDMDAAKEDLRFCILQLAEELVSAGVNVDCAPVLDALFEQTHEVIGDRAFSEKPEIISELAPVVCRRFLAMGVTPIIKHIPGHGRAVADSHLELPVVDASLDDLRAVDFVPFKALAGAEFGASLWAMSAHILYTALDKDLPLTLSASSIADIIRGEIGFEGILVSDDVSMKALDPYGSLAQRSSASIEAGCDLALYCAGKLDEMDKIANSVPKITEKTLKRLQNAAEAAKVAA